MFCLLLATQGIYAQEKVVERSSKKAPQWVGVSIADHIVVSAEAKTLSEAKDKCIADIRQSIINSVATNISSKELTLDTQTINGQTTDVLRRYESQVQAIAAKLPFVTGVSLDDAEIYWQKIYNKREKSYKYEVHAKYPFSLLKRNSLIMEYLKQEQEQNEKYHALKSEFSTFTEIEFINRAIAELKALEQYFVDQKRKDEAKVLASNYHKLYSQISIVPYHNALGEIVYYLNLEGRRMTTSRRPNIKSQYATSISFAPAEQNMYRITYNYDNCQDNDENKIEVIHNFASGQTMLILAAVFGSFSTTPSTLASRASPNIFTVATRATIPMTATSALTVFCIPIAVLTWACLSSSRSCAPAVQKALTNKTEA